MEIGGYYCLDEKFVVVVMCLFMMLNGIVDVLC